MAYCPRIVDAELRDLLRLAGCVVIEGAKGVGKTETARQAAGSAVQLDLDANARRLATVEAEIVLAGATPRVIDEWQLVPAIWNHVRRAVDARQDPGQFILTGSAVPADDDTRHSGAGRMIRLRMRPMSLFETGHSSAEVSLSALLDGARPRATDPGLTVAGIVDQICIGGWPRFTSLDPAAAQRLLRGYLDEITRTDIHGVDGVRRDPIRVGRVLQSLARNTGTSASMRAVAADTDGEEGALHRVTVSDYVAALERLMIIEDLPPWSPALRSRARLRSTATRHFVDPCLAVAALRGSTTSLLRDLEYVGFLFESLVVRDLRVYLQPLDARISQYRDSSGLEVDIVVEIGEGRWAGLEVKLGSNQVDAAAANLRKFASVVDTSRIGEPTFLGVVTATGYAYRREDGVFVLPIGALGP